jgi:hypothetical protein
MGTVYDCGGSCLGEYQIDGQPGERCPMAALFCCADWQSQGIQPTLWLRFAADR